MNIGGMGQPNVVTIHQGKKYFIFIYLRWFYPTSLVKAVINVEVT